jgi:diaminopimelate epimerase
MAIPEQRLGFTKMHGAGNDFVVLDLRGGIPPPSPSLCRALADRHAGVGCDQILTIELPRSGEAVAAYGIWNADGSPARQCGNGARCVAAWLVRDGAAFGERFVLDSPAGSHAVEVLGERQFRIAMGVPQFAPAAVPLRGYAQAQDEYALDLGGERVRFGAMSMGNPHAVIEVMSVDAAPVATLGPRLQADAAFPESVNVGFAEVVSRGRIRLRVYERGVGETLACGSGACAAAAVLMRRGRVDREVIVSLPGGDLHIAWPDEMSEILMAGPATFVFDGSMSLEAGR